MLRNSVCAALVVGKEHVSVISAAQIPAHDIAKPLEAAGKKFPSRGGSVVLPPIDLLDLVIQRFGSLCLRQGISCRARLAKLPLQHACGAERPGCRFSLRAGSPLQGRTKRAPVASFEDCGGRRCGSPSPRSPRSRRPFTHSNAVVVACSDDA